MMAEDGFAAMIETANGFFKELKANNERAWFEDRKAFYKANIQEPAALFADTMAETLVRLTDAPHKSKLFRIHRDVRFSKDKTPYNCHLHIAWPRMDRENAPTWFFGSAPDYLILGTGLPSPNPEALARIRAAIDRDGETLTKAIAKAGAALSDWGPPPLKRVPKPYAPDHPHGDLLKRKNLVVTTDLSDGWQADGLVPAVEATMARMLPVWGVMEEM